MAPPAGKTVDLKNKKTFTLNLVFSLYSPSVSQSHISKFLKCTTYSKIKSSLFYSKSALLYVMGSGGSVVKILQWIPEDHWFKPQYHQVASVRPLSKALKPRLLPKSCSVVNVTDYILLN